MGIYDDIINTDWLEQKKKSKHKKMDLNQRAKIFLPFAALTGYDTSLENMRRYSEEEMEEKNGNISFDDLNVSRII